MPTSWDTATRLTKAEERLDALDGGKLGIIGEIPNVTATDGADAVITTDPAILTLHTQAYYFWEELTAPSTWTLVGSRTLVTETPVTLSLSDVTNESDDGRQFRLVLENLAGYTISNTVTLSVTAPPPPPPEGEEWDATAITHALRHAWGVTCHFQAPGASSNYRAIMKDRTGLECNIVQNFDGEQPMKSGTWPKLKAQISENPDTRHIVAFNIPYMDTRGKTPTVAQIEANIALMLQYASGSRDAEFRKAFQGLKNILTDEQFARVVLRFMHENNAPWYEWGYVLRIAGGITAANIDVLCAKLAAAYKAVWERMLLVASQTLTETQYESLCFSFNLAGTTADGGRFTSYVPAAFPTNLPAGRTTRLGLTFDDYCELAGDVARNANCIANFKTLVANSTIHPLISYVGVDEMGPHCSSASSVATLNAQDAVMDEWLEQMWDFAEWAVENPASPGLGGMVLYEVDTPSNRPIYTKVFTEREAVLPGRTSTTYVDYNGSTRVTNYPTFAAKHVAKATALLEA